MSEFDEYLERLHSALDLSCKRADEICAEVRTHLEARAAQFRESGMGETAAAAEAVGSFGDAKQVAVRLAAANKGHRSAGAFRLVLAFAVASLGMVVAFGVLEGDAPWLDALIRPIAPERSLLRAVVWVLLMGVLMVPAALLAGMAAGRRYAWLAGIPPVLLGLPGFLLARSVLSGLVLSLILVFGVGPAMAGIAFLAPRMTRGRLAAYALPALCAGYLVTLGIAALLLQAHDLVGFLAAAGVAVWVLGVLATVALWAGGRRWRRAAAASSAASAICLLAMIRIVQLTCQGFYSESQAARAWEWLIGVETFLAVTIGVAVFAIRGRSKEASTETPVG